MMSSVMTMFDIPNHYDLNTASDYHTDKNTIMNDLKTPWPGYGNKMNQEPKIDPKNKFRLTDNQKHIILTFGQDRLKQLNDRLEERANKQGTSTGKTDEEKETDDILNEIRRGLNINTPSVDSTAQTLIDWELKKRRQQSKNLQVNNVDTHQSYMRGREIRQQRQIRSRATLRNGQLRELAKISNQNMEKSRKVIDINNLNVKKSATRRITMPMSGVSFDMGVGNP